MMFFYYSKNIAFEKVIILIRNPYDTLMAEFNRRLTNNNHTGHADLKLYSNYILKYFDQTLPNWVQFHDIVLNTYSSPNIHAVNYEKLKSNLIEEMGKILKFLGFEMTEEFSVIIFKSVFNLERPKS